MMALAEARHSPADRRLCAAAECGLVGLRRRSAQLVCHGISVIGRIAQSCWHLRIRLAPKNLVPGAPRAKSQAALPSGASFHMKQAQSVSSQHVSCFWSPRPSCSLVMARAACACWPGAGGRLGGEGTPS